MGLTESQLLEQTKERTRQLFTARVNDLAHGWEHIQRVYTLAQHIAEEEGANHFIVGMAALLHDLGRIAPDPSHTHHHADLSVEMAGRMLQGYGVSEERREEIQHAILAHSFSRGVEPRTLEAKVVRDADRLDALGAIGILRWAQTGVIRQGPQTRTYHPDDPFAEQHQPDDDLYLLDHFYIKLLKIGESMATASGRKLAKQRTQFMRAYLAELRQELS